MSMTKLIPHMELAVCAIGYFDSENEVLCCANVVAISGGAGFDLFKPDKQQQQQQKTIALRTC